MRGNVGDPQLVRPERADMPFDEVGRALVLWSRARRSGRLGASDTAQTHNPHEPHGRCTGPHDRHRDARQPRVGPASRASCGPQSRVAVLVDLGYLELVAQAPGARRPATAGVSQVLGAILTPAPVSNLADRPGPEFLLLGLDVLADQRDGRSHSAAIDKLTRSLGSRWLFAALGPLSPAP